MLFFGQAISLLGDGMVGVALAFAVLDLTGSIGDLGLVFAARTIPMVVFLLVGGVFADRLPRRAVMLNADVARLVTQGTIAVLLISGRAQIWQLVLTQAVYGTATAFFNPASTGLIPSVVSPGRLQQANALRALAMASGSVAGPALAGILVAAASPGWALAVDAASFGVSAVFLALLHLPPHERVPVKPFLHELGEGWREVTSRSWVWSILAFAGLANMAGNVFFIVGAYVAKTELGGAGSWALISSAFGLGAVAGGIVVLRMKARHPLKVACVGFGLLRAPAGAAGARSSCRRRRRRCAVRRSCGRSRQHALGDDAPAAHPAAGALARQRVRLARVPRPRPHRPDPGRADRGRDRRRRDAVGRGRHLPRRNGRDPFGQAGARATERRAAARDSAADGSRDR